MFIICIRSYEIKMTGGDIHGNLLKSCFLASNSVITFHFHFIELLDVSRQRKEKDPLPKELHLPGLDLQSADLLIPSLLTNVDPPF